MNADQVKKFLFDLGVDLCGIASVDRFNDPPEGFHPCDVFPACKSVVVFAKKFPVATLHCKTTVPYTIARNMLSDMLDKIAVQCCIDLEQHDIAAVP